MALIEKLTAIGNAIRKKNGTTEPILLADMPQAILNIPSGGDSNEFWDTYQQNGNRNQYDWGFGGLGWTDETFKPKYDIIAKSAQRIFSNSLITNLKKKLDDAGIVLDLSQSTSINYPFSQSTITDIGVLNVSKATHLQYFLHQSKSLKNVEKLVLNENGAQKFNDTFSFGECEALEHIIFEGTIGGDINLSWSPLDYESVLSIVNALADYIATDKAYEYTVNLSPITLNDLVDNHPEVFEIIDGKGWLY